MRGGDFIYVKNLIVKATTGIDGWQRAITQPLRFKIGINVGNRLRRMALTDDIRRTLNYDSLSTLIIEGIERKAHKDIDSTLDSAVKAINGYLSPGEWANVIVNQPKARLLAQAREIEINTRNPSEVTEILKEMRVPTIIGINPLERVCQQEIQLNLRVVRPAKSEVFTHKFTANIAKYVQGSSFLTIESFVNALAEYICKESKCSITEVSVSAAKPSALNMADCAGVEVTRKPSDFVSTRFAHDLGKGGDNVVYIAFGTNQGDRISNIKQSISELSERNIVVEQSSAIYQSEPMYYTEQPQFLNGVFKCRTNLDPDSLLVALKDIEYNVFKRVKMFDNGPRPLDLDIILFNNDFIESEKLTIPHKDMLNRSFVLRPLNDLLSSDPSIRYNESVDGGETTVLPLFSNSAKSPSSGYLEFDPEHPYNRPTTLMSILNATPDSFSDGGELLDNIANIAKVAQAHIRSGAKILDVGGYSTRPGAAEVTPEEESRRVCAVINEIRKIDTDVVISVDTFRGPVALDALNSGANVINDVFSGMLDPSILEVAAQNCAPIILSHARGVPSTMKQLTDYPEGIINGVAAELRMRINAALEAGCKPWQLILDPGLGFAKTPEQDLKIIRNFRDLKNSPILTDGLPVLPWLVGPSRKSFIGHFVDESVPKNRVAGTLAVITSLRQQGADIIRVHDTDQANQALKMADRIYA